MRTNKKIFLLLIPLIFVAGIIYAKTQYIDPLKVLSTSFTSLSLVNSFRINLESYETSSGQLKINAEIGKNDQLSKAEIKLLKIRNDPSENLTLTLLYNQDATYILPQYTKFIDLENGLALTYPELLKLKTYQSLKPVLEGKKWFVISSTTGESLNNGEVLPQFSISSNDENILTDKFIKSIIIRSINNKDQNFITLNLGFKKKELVDFVNYFKNLSLNIQPADIDQIIKIIESTDRWDDDLVIIKIHKNTNYPESITLSLPNFPENLEVSPEIKKLIPNNKENKPNYVGKLSFLNYNENFVNQKPESPVDFDNILKIAEQEISPILELIIGKDAAADYLNSKPQ